MSFRRLLLAGIASVLFVTVVTGTVSIVALHSATDRYERMGRELAEDLVGAHQLRTQAEALAAARRGFVSKRDPDASAKIAAASARMDELLHELHTRNLDTLSARELDNIDRAGTLFVAAASNASVGVDAMLQAFDRFEQAVTDFMDHQSEMFDDDLHRARVSSSRSELAVLVTTVLGLGLSIALAALVMKRLGQQFREAQTATTAARREAAARQELLAVVSHDLRSPLTTVTMGAALLDETMAPDPDAARGPHRHVRAIRNAADRMKSLIDDVLDVSRLEAGTIALHRAWWDLGGLLDRTVDMVQVRAAKAGVAVRVEPLATPVQAWGDPERVQQILGNLLTNALKFTPRGGEIVVEGKPASPHVEICVRDNGPGIAPEDQPHLFQRYWQGETAARPGSLGLGLYICKNLVEAHGGKIWVDSVPGHGSKFCFTLPA